MLDAATRRRQAVAEAGRRVAAFEGERSTLELRKQTLESEVGLAKGRLSHKARVDTFLEELQAEAHARRVGDFENLLTALVSEVLPKEAPIGLQLEIERGQPSLDIVSRHSADAVEDIYDDQGGALTNVVSMGLRMISVVRSGMQRFLMLDESDCWISNQRVPAFYSVLKEAARKVDVQCLAVSHHDVASFNEGIVTASLSGHPEAAGGVRIENAPRPYRWKDDENGIRSIRLRNFQGYVDETLHLAPGVNALTGENNVGKSSFVRAFRAVFYGEARDSLIRRGERQCSVEIAFPGGRTLHWNRQVRRNPVNLWKLLSADGAVVSENGMTYETGGRTVPEWVTDLFRIGPVEGLDVHAVKQKSPVFLLDKPGSTRAAVLSVGQESGHIRRMVALHKEACARDASCVKEGEVEMSRLLARIETLKEVDGLLSMVTEANVIADGITGREQAERSWQECLARIDEALVQHRSAKSVAEALASLAGEDRYRALMAQASEVNSWGHTATALEQACDRRDLAAREHGILAALPAAVPSVSDEIVQKDALKAIVSAEDRHVTGTALKCSLSSLPDFAPMIDRNDERIKAGKAVKDGRSILSNARAAMSAFDGLPLVLPILVADDVAEQASETIRTGKAVMARATAAAEKSASDHAACGAELDEAIRDMGGACPLCGHGIHTADDLVGGHAHMEGHAHA